MKATPMNAYEGGAEEFQGRIAHGDAFRYFLKEMHGKTYGPEEMIHAWQWFLAGWRAKGKQRMDLRS